MLSCHITRKIPNKMTGFVSGLKHTKNCLYLQNISKRWNDYWTLCSLLIFWLFHVHAAATKNWIPDRNHWLKRLFAGRKLKMQKTEFGFMIVFNMAIGWNEMTNLGKTSGQKIMGYQKPIQRLRASYLSEGFLSCF